MAYKLITQFLGFVIIAGCSNSQSLKKDPISIPFNFVEPNKAEIFEENEKGGEGDNFIAEDEFVPHPLIPLEEITNNDQKPVINDVSYTGQMLDLGVEIEPEGNKNPISNNLIIADPMLESIRQDLMLKWGIDETVTHEKNTKTKTISDIEAKISKIENSIKGDLAALRSENLMLVSRIQELEKQYSSGKTHAKKPPKRVTNLKKNKPTMRVAAKKTASVPKSSYKNRYDSALAEYRSRRFKSAIKKFKSLIDEDNYNSLSDNAQYWMGECFYHLAYYSKAVTEFEKVLKYSNSNKKDSAILMKGKALKHLGQKLDAIKEFKTLIAQYPRSSYTKRARELIMTLEKS